MLRVCVFRIRKCLAGSIDSCYCHSTLKVKARPLLQSIVVSWSNDSETGMII
jgi:hypothetical protein